VGPPVPSRSGRPSVELKPFSDTFEIDYRELTVDVELGRGDFGVVFKGFWRGGTVAIKQVHNIVSEKDLLDFKGEAAVMRNLRPHTNVVQFLGITSVPHLCIITEFMEGGSLYNVIHSEAKIDMGMVQTWVQGIAAGMLHLHSEGVFHRDLAARNVLLTAGGQAKIADFGLSRKGQSGASVSQTASATGPLKWMAPESITQRIYSTQSDVWSFGVTIWEIVARDEPYPDLNPVQAAVEITRGQPPLRLEPPSYCPKVLCELMTSSFNTNPLQRPDFKNITQRLKNAKLEDWLIGYPTGQQSQYGAMPGGESYNAYY